MLNSSDFINRLKTIMQHHNISASLFADKVGVQRSSISHILSGRNKPSLEFVLKIVNSFKDVSTEWLLYGKGIYPKKETLGSSNSASTLFETSNNLASKKMSRIVVFYTDGTFEEFKSL